MYAEIAQDCLAAIEPLLPYQAAAFYRVSAHFQPSDYVLRHMRQDMHQVYEAQFQQIDPLLPSEDAVQHAVLTLEESCCQPPQAVANYRQAFLQPFDIADVVEVFIQPTPTACFGVSLLRQMGQGCFQADDLALLHRLLPLLSVVTKPLIPAGTTNVLDLLTPRELAVAKLIAGGASNKVVANTLQMSLPTVKTHLQHLFDKLGVNNRTALAHRLYPSLVAH
ncbi:LuxR C-terminal-related transcriptional regulator [Leeia sp. TBRC 13508]|uniref:LuxR C-terminal-related transcriptional regulator n=1 Tax=Leeia speluncae TaxID=2884804 RepID=A0ABS8D510_9NEIS|nr:LuxR C-terminal-related transcriptional regulator [Leeia speluncae]MCB6183056.1 LuxR C-terminal-related transcriptional regulator [Leeia speluncae]